jgi:cell shape-determining protein MreD
VSGQRPPVAATASVLTIGTVASAAALAAAFVSGLAGAASLGTLLSTVGVVALLITPAAGLVATFFELRPVQPRAAQLALVVLGVLALSTLVALITH